MRRLFTDGGAYTEECSVIENKITAAIMDIFSRHTDVDIRDLQHAAMNAAVDAGLCMVLDRKKD